MILINLLPHREERRKRKKIAFFAGLGVAAVAGLAIIGVWYLVVEQLISSQQQRNTYLQGEVAKLDVQIKDIASLRAEIASLKSRQKAVEDLQIDRNVPVHVLNELVKQVPEGIYITGIKQDGQNLGVTGIAQTQERVSEFLRNTAYSSEWLVKPELVESKAVTIGSGTRDVKRLFEFSMRLTIKRPAETAAAASAPGAAASAASGVATTTPAVAVPAAPAAPTKT